MPDLRCIVVCEGSSDFPFINSIIQYVAGLNNKTAEAILLAPDVDATGKYEKFGYEGVKRWCKYNLNQYQQFGRNKIGSLLAWHSADLLLIHMDADIADRIELDGVYFNGQIADRKNWCSRSLDSWLGVIKASVDINYVIPTFQIESWLLATFDNLSNPEVFPVAISNYETISDVETKLLALKYGEDKEKPGRLYKEKNLFETNPNYAKRLLANIDIASSRCSELADFQRLIAGYC